MRIIGIILIYILGLYFLRKVFYIINVLSKKNSKDVEIIINFYEERETKTKRLMIVTPFYNEKKHFYISLGWGGLQVGYTPYEMMTKVLKRVFVNKFLFQVVFDDLLYPNSIQLKAIKGALEENGIVILEGALLYNPQAIEKNSLEYGVTDGTDLFYICSQVDKDKINTLATQVKEWKKLKRFDTYAMEKEYLNAEGELLNIFETWKFYHRDESSMICFANETFKASIEKLFMINKLSIPSDFVIPKLESVFKDIFTFSGMPNLIKIYFEEDNLIIFREQGKSYETFIRKMSILPKKNRIKEALSYFIPELIGIKAYSKKTLRKFGIKFFFLFMYMAVIALGLSYLILDVWRIENIILMAICFFVTPLLGIVSLVLSIYYSFLGIFGRRDFVRARI